MKLSDYLASFLAKKGIQYVFQIIGGASAHMVHSIAAAKGIDFICFQHEQAAAMAAESYSRTTKNLGCAMATSGPGMTNLITGICCAYFDSIPTIYITGQVNTSELRKGKKVRQIGFQETDIVEMVKPITKFAVQITDPNDIELILETAVYIAKSGRPGPVLVDIPMNIQHAQIDPKKLKRFTPADIIHDVDSKASVNKNIQKAMRLILKAERPVVIAGGGIRYADLTNEFEKLVDLLGIPVVATWSGIDTLYHDHPLYIGQIGVYGNRGANFTVQNSDCIVSLGSRLDTRITGGRPETFAREAKKIVVDIDRSEIFKGRGLTPDVAICSDLRIIIPKVISFLKNNKRWENDSWIKKTILWKKRYPAVLDEWRLHKDNVNPYFFIETLADVISEKATIITDCGGNLTWTIQAFKVKRGQRLFSAMGNSPMGYALAASIGASFGLGKKEVICIMGDGGMQLNIQELQTIKYYNLPIKVFILNSRSYAIIMQFQEVYFESNFLATQSNSGYSAPDFVKVAKAYGLQAKKIDNHHNLRRKIKEALSIKGPVICDVWVPENAKLIPKLTARRVGEKYIQSPIEDMTPFLPREEFLKNMIIAPLEE